MRKHEGKAWFSIFAQSLWLFGSKKKNNETFMKMSFVYISLSWLMKMLRFVMQKSFCNIFKLPETFNELSDQYEYERILRAVVNPILKTFCVAHWNHKKTAIFAFFLFATHLVRG